MSVYANMLREDSVFAEVTVINDGIKLKDPKPIREAFVLNELANLPKDELKDYVKSSQARSLVENEIISPAALEDLAKSAYADRGVEFMACHMAKENEDERWNELVRHRAEERRLLDDIIRDYGPGASKMCDGYRQDFKLMDRGCGKPEGEEGCHGHHGPEDHHGMHSDPHGHNSW